MSRLRAEEDSGWMFVRGSKLRFETTAELPQIGVYLENME